MSEKPTPSGKPHQVDHRYSLRDILEEVKVERRDSQFARQLVDSMEIDKMFSEARLKKKKVK